MFCIEFSIQPVIISVLVLTHFLPPFSATNFTQKVVLVHNSQNCFWIFRDFFTIQPEFHSMVAVCLFTRILLCTNFFCNSKVFRRAISRFVLPSRFSSKIFSVFVDLHRFSRHSKTSLCSSIILHGEAFCLLSTFYGPVQTENCITDAFSCYRCSFKKAVSTSAA